MNLEKLLTVLYRGKKEVQKEISETAAYYHGWNAAIDHVILLIRNYKE